MDCAVSVLIILRVSRATLTRCIDECSPLSTHGKALRETRAIHTSESRGERAGNAYEGWAVVAGCHRHRRSDAQAVLGLVARLQQGLMLQQRMEKT